MLLIPAERDELFRGNRVVGYCAQLRRSHDDYTLFCDRRPQCLWGPGRSRATDETACAMGAIWTVQAVLRKLRDCQVKHEGHKGDGRPYRLVEEDVVVTIDRERVGSEQSSSRWVASKYCLHRVGHPVARAALICLPGICSPRPITLTPRNFKHIA